jgi:hypothetical protein
MSWLFVFGSWLVVPAIVGIVLTIQEMRKRRTPFHRAD